MTYQGAKSRELLQDPTSVFAVSKVRLDGDGRVTDVLWASSTRGPIIG